VRSEFASPDFETALAFLLDQRARVR